MPATNTCQYQDCNQSIRRDHHLCRNHYYEAQDGVISACSGCGQAYKPTEYDVCRSCYGNRSSRQSQQAHDWPQSPSQISPELDRLRNEISQVRRIIFENPRSINDSERATEHHCVIPILRGLGWDVHSPHEFVPQQRISRGRGLNFHRVDFALHLDGNPAILVEVKRHGVGYDPSWEQQLMRYIAHMTSGFGILTNGQIWLIYVVEQGNARHVSTLDIIENPLEAIAALQALSRERLASRQPTQFRRDARQTAQSRIIRERPAPAPTMRPPTDDEVRERLKNFRIDESRRRRLRPFMILNNQTIENIVEHRPGDIDDLVWISGVGEKTLELYGDDIIRIVNSPVRQ